MRRRRSRAATQVEPTPTPPPPVAGAPTPCLSCAEKAGRPYAVEPIAGRTAAVSDVVVPAAGLLTAVVDGHLVALQAPSGRGVLLNASAALILTAFDGERTVAEVIEQLAGETGMEPDLLRGDVRATVDRLLAQGIVSLAADVAAGERDSVGSAPAVHQPDPDRWAPTVDRLLSGVPWAWQRGPVRLAATSVRVRADDAEVGDHLDRLLGALADVTDGEPPRHTMSVVSRPGAGSGGRAPARARYRLVLDGRVVSRLDTPEAAAAHVLHHLDELAVSGSPGALIFHAGAVERDGRVVVVLGVSGRGKSTLTAALVQRGFRYLSDEVVAVDAVTSEVWPYAKALDLHPGSLELLGLDPATASIQLPGWKAKVLPDRLGGVGSGGRPALLVFLAEPLVAPATPGDAPVESVPPAEALVAILPVTFERTLVEPANFGALAALCESTPSIRIGRAPLDAVIAQVEAALA